MSISTTINKVQYTANGSTTAFSFPYKFLENTNLIVTVTNVATGVDTLQVLSTNYTVTGAGAAGGGTVTFTVAPTAARRITIERVVNLTQETDYQPDDDFPAEVHESALDKLTMMVQQVNAKITRTLTGPATDTLAFSTLPAQELRANKTLVFDTLGQASVSGDSYISAAANAAASATQAQTAATTATSQAAATTSIYNLFQSKYLGSAASDPILDSQGNAVTIGAFYYNNVLNQTKVYTGTLWNVVASNVNVTSRRFRYVGSAAQVTLTGADANGTVLSYDAPYVDVFINGLRCPANLLTASNGTSVVLNASLALRAGDVVEIVAYGTTSIISLANDAVTETKIAGSAVTTAKIAAGAVTTDKVGATGVVAGTYGGAGTSAKIVVTSGGQITSAVDESTTSARVATNGLQQFPDGCCGRDNGGRNTVFIGTDKNLYVCGTVNAWNGLGSNTGVNRQYVQIPIYHSEALIQTGSLFNPIINPQTEWPVQLYLTASNLFFLTNLKKLYAMGTNSRYALGLNDLLTRDTIAGPILTDVEYFSVGRELEADNHAAAVKTDGSLWTWGYNGNGQCGNNTTVAVQVPTQVTLGSVSGKTIVKVFAFGGTYGRTFAIDSNQDLHATGYNAHGQLGLGDQTQRQIFNQITSGQTKAEHVYGHGNYTTYPRSSVYIKYQGKLYATGANETGQLGVSDVIDKSSFVLVGLPGAKSVSEMCVSGSYANGAAVVARMTDNTVYTWGFNGYGELGRNINPGTNSSTPGQIVMPGGSSNPSGLMSKVLMAGNPSDNRMNLFMLGTNGKVYSSGSGLNGQLGNGQKVNKQMPVAAMGSQVYTDISVSGLGNEGFKMLARDNLGRLWAWGYNLSFGFYGSREAEYETVPVKCFPAD